MGESPLAKDLIRPVLANLLTASLLFVSVLLFKEPIYALFSRRPTAEFPLYCVAEPYQGPQGEVRADLFIINKRGDSYTDVKLKEVLKAYATDDPASTDPSIRLKWVASACRVERIDLDDVFNADKGKMTVDRPVRPDGKLSIRVQEIGGKGILKAVVVTNCHRGEVNRGTKAALPFEIEYNGD